MAIAIALSAAVSACGGGRPSERSNTAPEPDVVHIHELGVDPRDGSIIVATHVGLFSVALDDTRPRRIGEHRPDTMSLTVLSPGEFLGSGHAYARSGAPSALGLVRSNDAGLRWRSVAIAGKVDFHVLRAERRRVFGVSATDQRLFVSDDEGATWRRRFMPAPLGDLVIKPGDPEQILASSQEMLFASDDAGRSWRAASLKHSGLLAWPREDALYVADARGVVSRSRDAGRTWRTMGEIGGAPVAFTAYASELFAAMRDDSILMSYDGGRTWKIRARG